MIICNIYKKELIKIIKDNNKNEFNNNIYTVLNENPKENLLINIFVGEKNSNVLIFKQKDEQLVIPTNGEKKFFIKFYNQINGYNLKSKSSLFKKLLFEKENLFGNSLINKNEEEKRVIYTSFINQGIKSLLDNDIITKKDKDFIIGYLILLIYIANREDIIKSLYYNIHIFMKILKDNKFNEIEQIKIAISYVMFVMNNDKNFHLEITKDLKEDSPYLKGFNFYESIIKDLNEESEIMLMFLQLNSGFGLELLNNKECYNISMLSIEEIKNHLIINIPKYFFFFISESDDYIISDQRTQLLAFNAKELFDLDDPNEQNNIMNIVIGMFHESGHLKLHMKVGAKKSPIIYINKNYELLIQKNIKNKKGGEAGRLIDNYLYGYGLNSCLLIMSRNFYKLMEKKLFLGNLDDLNIIADQIVTDFLNGNTYIKALVSKNNKINSLENTFKIKKKKKNLMIIL